MNESSQLRMLAPDEVERLAVLARISRAFNASYNLDETLSSVMDVVVESLGVGRGCVMLASGQGAPLQIAVSRGIDPRAYWELEAFEYSRTVATRAWETGESVLTNDALRDAQLSKIESLKKLRTRSLMCVPMRVRGISIGLIYVDNDKRANLFTPTDLRLLEIIADLAATAVERARYFVEMQLHKSEPAALSGLESLGRHARAVAHDISNVVSIIRAHCDATQAYVRRGRYDKVDTSLSEINMACAHAHALTRLLAHHAEDRHVALERIDLNRLVSDIEPFLRVLLGPGYELAVHPGRGQAWVEAGALEIDQIVFNFVVNARQALAGKGDGGRLIVESAIDADGEHVHLSVSDNGIGMAEDVRRALENGESEGVGLRIIAEILERRKGRLKVYSVPGEGSRFEVILPLVR